MAFTIALAYVYFLNLTLNNQIREYFRELMGSGRAKRVLYFLFVNINSIQGTHEAIDIRFQQVANSLNQEVADFFHS